MTGDQWIALAGVGFGGIVGLGGLAFGYFNARSERRHTERLARGGRLHQQRLAAYADLAGYLERERLFLHRTEPMIGPQPDPPPPLDDDEWARLNGRLAVSGSREALAALEEAQRRSQSFDGARMVYVGMRNQNALQMPEARRRMDEARRRASEAINEVERLMRDELAGL
jgi:hypothetical protein